MYTFFFLRLFHRAYVMVRWWRKSSLLRRRRKLNAGQDVMAMYKVAEVRIAAFEAIAEDVLRRLRTILGF